MNIHNGNGTVIINGIATPSYIDGNAIAVRFVNGCTGFVTVQGSELILITRVLLM